MGGSQNPAARAGEKHLRPWFIQTVRGSWAEQIAGETGLLSGVPDNLRAYFDFERYARDCELDGSIWTANPSESIAVF